MSASSVARHLRSFAIFKTQNALSSFYAQRIHRYPTLLRLLDEMNERSPRSSGVSVADSVHLYETVLRRRPLHILELGAGQSSAVIAQAAVDAGHNPRFVAVEESREWLDHHKQIIPQRLQSKLDLIQLETTVDDSFGQPAARYVGIPELPYGMIHIDGPAMHLNRVQVSSDLLFLLPSLAADCVVLFDAREATARYARPHFERAGFRYSRHWWTIGPVLSRSSTQRQP